MYFDIMLPTGKYLSTLSHLDGAFDKFSQRDLVAASLPARAEVEQRRCVITNHHCAQKSGDWGRLTCTLYVYMYVCIKVIFFYFVSVTSSSRYLYANVMHAFTCMY